MMDYLSYSCLSCNIASLQGGYWCSPGSQKGQCTYCKFTKLSIFSNSPFDLKSIVTPISVLASAFFFGEIVSVFFQLGIFHSCLSSCLLFAFCLTSSALPLLLKLSLCSSIWNLSSMPLLFLLSFVSCFLFDLLASFSKLSSFSHILGLILYFPLSNTSHHLSTQYCLCFRAFPVLATFCNPFS